MAKYYDKNLQLINNLDIHLNIYKTKTLKMSVLRNFADDFSKTNNATYDDNDLEMVCEALQFLDINIIDDIDEVQCNAPSQADRKDNKVTSSARQHNAPTDNNKWEDSANSSHDLNEASNNTVSDNMQMSDQKSSYDINGQGISYNSIQSELDQLLHPQKLDFTQLAATRNSAELCQLIIDNPENYLKVMYAISKQL